VSFNALKRKIRGPVEKPTGGIKKKAVAAPKKAVATPKKAAAAPKKAAPAKQAKKAQTEAPPPFPPEAPLPNNVHPLAAPVPMTLNEFDAYSKQFYMPSREEEEWDQRERETGEVTLNFGQIP
jgi:hypothetical protein